MNFQLPENSTSDLCLAGLSQSRRSQWDDLAWMGLVISLILVFLNFQDFGLTHDEEVQANYGLMLLNWYRSGFQDMSAFNYSDLFWYGGLFDLLAAAANLISPYGQYETRHLLGGLWWVAGLAGAWQLGRLAGGPRVGFISMGLLAFTPAFMGHGFNNPKDAPFAVAMTWGIIAITHFISQLPRPRTSTIIALGCSFGVALSIRVGAVLLVGYLGLALSLYGILVIHRRGWTMARIQVLPILQAMAGALLLAYAIMAVFWPWGVMEPLNPWRAMQHFSRYDIDIVSLFAGSKVDATDLPALYLSEYIIITVPEVLLVGLLGLSIGVDRPWIRQRENRAAIGMIALAFLFPMLFFIVFRPTAYDGLRHFLFVLPPLAVLGGIGLDRLWCVAEAFSQRLGRAVLLALLVAAVIQGWIMARLHPDEYIYYNMLAGGVRGADGQWELDYWSNSMHEAVDRLNQLVLLDHQGAVPEQPVNVIVCGNDLSATYFFPPWFRLVKSLSEADFAMTFTQADCWKTWRGKSVVVVDRFGAVLSVVKDRRGLPDPEKE